MGNTITAFYPPQRTLRVYCDQGRLLQFKKSMPALKLMQDHPSHLLVSGAVKPKECRFGEARHPNDHVRIRVVRPGDVLQVGQSYFMVYIPDQYSSRFAKYFYPPSPSASPGSKYSQCPSPRLVFDSSSASPLIVFTSPPASPQRARHGRTPSSPLAMYIPSPLSGSTREKMRQPKQQTLRNSTNLSRVQSSGRPSASTIRDLIRIDINEPFQRNSTDCKGIQSPRRPSTSTDQLKRTLAEHLREIPADSNRIQSPARPSRPIAQDSIRRDLSQHFMQSPDRIQSPRRPGTPIAHDAMRRSLSSHFQQNPSRLMRSPGRLSMPSHDMTRSFNHQQKGSSPYHSKRSPQRSPRRPIKSCQGKPGSRPRRSGMRSPHHKGAPMRSPGRIEYPLGSSGGFVSRPIAVTDNVCVPCCPRFEREMTKKPKSGRAASASSISYSIGSVRAPLLMRRGSFRSGHWTPALDSISED